MIVFDVVDLVRIDMLQFNLIITASALPHLVCVRDFSVSTHGQHVFERQPLLNMPGSTELEMDIFYLILWERSHLCGAESWRLPLHHKVH